MCGQATLAPGDSNTRSILSCKVDDGEPIMLCSLREGVQESANLDLVYDRYTEFTVEGAAAVHLSGYYMPEYEGTSHTSQGICSICPKGSAQVASPDLLFSFCGVFSTWLCDVQAITQAPIPKLHNIFGHFMVPSEAYVSGAWHEALICPV
jgi:hypothetical protein